MEYYDFEVLKGDETIAVARSVALPDMNAAWSRIAELANNVNGTGMPKSALPMRRAK